MDSSLLPGPDDIVVDKENNEWVLTYRVNDHTTLRLRIHHLNRHDPNDAICEIRDGSDQPFREVGRPDFECIEFDPDCWIGEPDLSDWPTECRSEFIKLARVWSVLTAVAEWEYALGDRQAELDASSFCSCSETTATEPPRE